MSEYFVVRDDVGERGLRRLHIMKSGDAVDLAQVLSDRGLQRDEVCVYEYVDEALKLHHIRIYWRDRHGDAVPLPDGGIS